MSASLDLLFLDTLRELHLHLAAPRFVPVAAPPRPLQHLPIRPRHYPCTPPPSRTPRPPSPVGYVSQPRPTPNCA